MNATQSQSIDFGPLRDPRYPVHKIADDLEPYLRVLVDRIHPVKIILFGSQAYGTPTEHSDVDLLIVRDGAENMLESNLEIRKAFRVVDAPPLSFTLISTTPELLRGKLDQHSAIYSEIVEKGLELYAA